MHARESWSPEDKTSMTTIMMATITMIAMKQFVEMGAKRSRYHDDGDGIGMTTHRVRARVCGDVSCVRVRAITVSGGRLARAPNWTDEPGSRRQWRRLRLRPRWWRTKTGAGGGVEADGGGGGGGGGGGRGGGRRRRLAV